MYNKNRLSEDFTNRYRQYIKHLLAIPGYRQEVRLSDEAETLYGEFLNKNAAQNNSGKQPDYLNEVNSKLNVIVLRSAVLFHFSQWACTGIDSGYINASTMQSAINLTEYFRITAKKVYRIISKHEADNLTVAKFLNEKGNTQTDIAKALKITHQAVSKMLAK